jgi:hypothetical protein
MDGQEIGTIDPITLKQMSEYYNESI